VIKRLSGGMGTDRLQQNFSAGCKDSKNLTGALLVAYYHLNAPAKNQSLLDDFLLVTCSIQLR
jgi:hypothetical protein